MSAEGSRKSKGQNLSKQNDSKRPISQAITSGPNRAISHNHGSALHTANGAGVNQDNERLEGKDEGLQKVKGSQGQCALVTARSSFILTP